jgi:hypothetical protein
VTELGEKAKFTIETLAEEDFFAFGADDSDATAEGAASGAPPEVAGSLSEGFDGVRRVEPGDVPSGGAAGVVVTGAGSVVVGVVVVVVVVVSASCAAEIAGTAHTATRTSIPPARALAPFIDRIVRGIDSQSTTEYRGSWIA